MTPHTATILMVIEVSNVLPTGECSGNIIPDKDLEEYGLKRKVVVAVKGLTKEECLSKLRDKINEFRK